jgi:hypothetical protein
LSAQLDFQNTQRIPSVYPVDIILDGKKVGVIYLGDVEQFNSGLKAEMAKSGASLDNIPRPAIVYDNGQELYFEVTIDNTPGGVEVGDQAVVAEHLKDPGKKILSGRSVWEYTATNFLKFFSEKLGDAKEELTRLIELIEQVEQSRLSKNGKLPLFIYLKAQISKKLLLALGGGIHFMGKYLQKLPFVKEEGMIYLTPTSCSTNGASYVTHALSAMFGGFGRNLISLMGTTFHMYTGGDKGKADKPNPFGHTNPKSTGAAKGVKQNLKLNAALFTALRTPTSLVEGDIDIVGGSIFDMLYQLPENVSEDLLKAYLNRIGAEFPEVLKVFTSTDQVDGRYTWKDTIAGQRTGSILYDDYITKVFGNIVRMPVGYDNEVSFTLQMIAELKQIFLILDRQSHTAKLLELAPLAGTASSPEPTASSPAEFTQEDITVKRILMDEYPFISEDDANWLIESAKERGGLPEDYISDLKTSKGKSSSPVTNPSNQTPLGGIDFRGKAMQINYQPMGSFIGMKVNLPVLSKARLDKFDVDVELAQMEKMLDSEILPSGERIKEVMAACVQKGEFEARRDDIMVLLVKMGILEEKRCCLQDCSPEYKEALVLADALAV